MDQQNCHWQGVATPQEVYRITQLKEKNIKNSFVYFYYHIEGLGISTLLIFHVILQPTDFRR